MLPETIFTTIIERKSKLFIPKTALIVASHPDDAEINAGGLIHSLTSIGADVTYVICTNGDKGSWEKNMSSAGLSEIRKKEQLESAQLLGVNTVDFLDLSDGHLHVSMHDLTQELTRKIREYKPEMIVTHDPWKQYDFNQDHRATGFAVAHAVVYACNRLFLPEHEEEGLKPHFTPMITFFNTDNPNLWVNLSDYFVEKEAAIKVHYSQFGKRTTFFLELEKKAIGDGSAIGVKYAETHHIELNT